MKIQKQEVEFTYGGKVEVVLLDGSVKVWILNSITDAGLFVTQDQYGMTFFPWHRVEYLRVDDTLKDREVV